MKIGIVTRKPMIDSLVIQELEEILSRHRAEIYFLSDRQMGHQGNRLGKEEFFSTVELLIVLGGDGTLLEVAQSAAQHNIPILGINYGRVGLLTDLEKDELHLVEKIFSQEYSMDERMMLVASVTEGEKEVHRFHAWNEVALSRGNFAKMLEMNLYIDNDFCTAIRADGLIISTPTGSTAYSLSAGGAVVDPQAEVFAVTPICPHTLNIRPLIIYKNRTIRIERDSEGGQISYLSFDGNEAICLSPKAKIQITVADQKVKLIRIANRNFYSVLKDKL